jgi:hypothetical protein
LVRIRQEAHQSTSIFRNSGNAFSFPAIISICASFQIHVYRIRNTKSTRYVHSEKQFPAFLCLFFVLTETTLKPNIMEKVKIGENSRKVWHVLNEMKRISIQELCSRTNLAIEDAMLAIGWLARENSIFIEKRENTIYLSNGSEYHFCFG